MKKLLASFLWLIVSLFVVLPVQAATLSLSPATGTFNKNCNFSVKVDLDTVGAQTDGTDAILIYDPSRFTANSITNGTIYPDYPGNTIDNPTPGKIVISGLASLTQPFTGKGTLATVNFTVKSASQTGVSQIKFDFDPNNKAKTDDSNVVERTTIVDILNSVTDGSYTVGTGTSCAAQGATGTIATGSGTIDDGSTLPDAGTQSFTATLAIIGSVLTVLGILGLVIL
jgi:hypothetical protein